MNSKVAYEMQLVTHIRPYFSEKSCLEVFDLRTRRRPNTLKRGHLARLSAKQRRMRDRSIDEAPFGTQSICSLFAYLAKK